MTAHLNTESVTRPGAFFGRISISVREAAQRCHRGDIRGRTLDVGCGNGLFFAALGAGQQTYHGVDSDRDLLGEARRVMADNKLDRVDFVAGDGLYLPYRAGSFDHVFLLNTLVNIPTDEGADHLLDELVRVCRPGGRLILDIRNRWNPVLAYRYWRNNRREDFSTRGHDLRDVKRVLRGKGCHEIAVRSIGPYLPFATGFVLQATRIAAPDRQ